MYKFLLLQILFFGASTTHNRTGKKCSVSRSGWLAWEIYDSNVIVFGLARSYFRRRKLTFTKHLKRFHLTYCTDKWNKTPPNQTSVSNRIGGVLSLLLALFMLIFFVCIEIVNRGWERKTNVKQLNKQTIFSLFNSFLKFFTSYFGQFHNMWLPYTKAYENVWKRCRCRCCCCRRSQSRMDETEHTFITEQSMVDRRYFF